jgi:diguanylate cyclase (GGDEF)-like protein
VTSRSQASNRIFPGAANTPERTSRGRPASRALVPRLIATTVVPLLALAWLSWFLLSAPASPGLRLGGAALLLLAALGIAAGGWSIVTLSRGTSRTRRGGGSPRESVDPLRAMAADRAAEIACYQAKLEELGKQLEATQAELKETSFKDELTGLYNRRFFFVRLEEEISRHRRFSHPVAVVLFDLDGFKEVNDGQGHMIGDETLRDIGQVLTKYSRGINVVARYGGDEFVILLVETSREGARLYAERIRQILCAHPYSHGMHVTASFGVASLPDDEATTAEDLVRIADEALYVAKRGGKNQVAGVQPPGPESA